MAVVSLPHTLVAGTPENVNHVQANEEALRDQINNVEDANIGAAKLSAAAIQDATLTDAKLASPNNTAIRVIASTRSSFGAGGAVGTYLPTESGTTVLPALAQTIPPQLLYLDPARYAVAGKTTTCNVQIITVTNNVGQPATAYTVTLNPIASNTGTSGGILYTLGAAVGTGASIVFPGADTNLRVLGADFTMPVAGLYTIAVAVTGATTPANSYVHIGTELTVRYV